MLDRKRFTNTRYFISIIICILYNFKAKWSLFVLHMMSCFIYIKTYSFLFIFGRVPSHGVFEGSLVWKPLINQLASHGTHHRLFLKSCLCTFFTLKCNRNMGIADVDGFSFKMRIVQVHIKFNSTHHIVPRPSHTVSHSWPRPLYNVDNGVVFLIMLWYLATV